MTEPGDAEFVQRTLAGDTGAFATLVRRYRRAALVRAFGVVNDPFLAEDVAQDAFVHAYEQLMELHNPSHFGAWLMKITHRLALNALRSVNRRRTVPIDESISAGDRAHAAEPLRIRELRSALLAGLSTLSPMQRTIVLLSDLEDWRHERIAETLGISVAMSRRHLSDARRHLRTILEPELS